MNEKEIIKRLQRIAQKMYDRDADEVSRLISSKLTLEQLQEKYKNF